MLCRLIVTCALLGHVVLSLPAARAPRYTPLPDEVDSDETRRVLGSSVVTSVSVIMDLGNGSQAMFSETGNHHGEHNNDGSNKPESTVDNPLWPEKPVGSPPALMSPDRYEFYTFDESGELVRRLMTLEQIQSLIAGGDDANRIAAIPLDIEIDTAPSPQATDPQGQVVASVQQVLAEELLASTKKNGTEPQETEVEVEAEVQEVPPPPSSPKPEHEDDSTDVKVSTETAPEAQEPTVASTTQYSTDAHSSTVLSESDSIKEESKPDEPSASSTEAASQEETVFKDETSMVTTQNETSSTASSVLEEEAVQQTIGSDEVKETQMPAEAVTEETAMPEEHEKPQTPVQTSTEKQEEMQEHFPSPPSVIDSVGEDMDDVKGSDSIETSSQDGMEEIDDKVSEAPVMPDMEIQEEENVPESPAPTSIDNEEESVVKVTTSPVESSPVSEEVDDKIPTEDEPIKSNAESEGTPVESDISIKDPLFTPTDEEPLSEIMPVDESILPTLFEPVQEVQPSESSDRINTDTTPSSVASTSFVETPSDDKDDVDDIMSTGILMTDADDILPSSIPTDSHVLDEADLAGVSDEVPPSEPISDEEPDEVASPLAENGLTMEENPAAPELEVVLPEMSASPDSPETVSESETVMPEMTPSEADIQESQSIAPTQSTGAEEGGDKEEVEEEDEQDLLDQLAESVSSVLSQVTDLDIDDDDEFKKKPDSPVTTAATTLQPQDALSTDDGDHPNVGDSEDEVKGEDEEQSPYTESILPDMRDPTKDTLHVDFSAAEDEVSVAPTADEVNMEEDMGQPGDMSTINDPVEEETETGDESKKDEEEDGSKKDEVEDESKKEEEEGNIKDEIPSTISDDSIQDTSPAIATTESYVEDPIGTEMSKPFLESEEIPIKVDETDKESESPLEVVLVSDTLEKEGEPTMGSPTDVEKINLPNLEDLENVQAVVGEEDDSKDTEPPLLSSTEQPELIPTMMEDDLVKESSGEASETAEESKPTEEDETGEEKFELVSVSTVDSSDTMTTKPMPVEEENVKDGEENVEEVTMGEKDEEKKEEEHKGVTTEDSIMATTEVLEEQEEDDQSTVTPIKVTVEPKIPNDQSVDDSSLEETDTITHDPDDEELIEDLHKEAEGSDPLIGGEKHAAEGSTESPLKDEEASTQSDSVESSSSEEDDKELVNIEAISPSSVSMETEQPMPSEHTEKSKPSDTSTAVQDEVKETAAPPSQAEVEAESTKPTIVTDIEQQVDSSSPEPPKNPWTSIPIPIRPQVSTTLESQEQPTSRPISLSTADPGRLSFSSASPDDLPDPNGLLPLLTEKPEQSASLKPSDDPLSSTTVEPASSSVAPSTTQTEVPAGAVVPPLMPAFPQAPEGNVGLEATSASTDPDVKRFVDLCNDLAFALYGQVTAASSSVPVTRGANGGGVQTRSLVVSPFALFSLLAMVFLGARGPTSEEMNDLLRLDDMVTFNPHLVLQNVTDAVITSPGVSAAAFVRELYSDKSNGKLLEFYKARAKAFYDGHVEEVDFKEVNDVIRRRTNHLVRWQTRGRVPEYLRGSSLKLRPPLAALSANFFEADCQRASSTGTDGEMYFEVPATGRRRRRLVPVPAVVWRGVFLAGHDAGLDATVLELRHGGGEVSTVLVLPGRHGQSIDAGDISGGLTRLENWLINGGRESWSALLRSAVPRGPLEVQLPRFAHRSVLNATGALSRMGLQHLFQDGKADLGGLDGGLGGKLHLADMIQMTAFGVCADDGSSKRHLETYPSAQRTGRKHTRSVPDELPEESPEEVSEVAETNRGGKSGWVDELAREEDDSYVFAAAAAARELPLALRPRQARIPRPVLKQQHSRIVLPRLRFDRPFLYFVRHNPSGFILLMGRFNPRLFPSK